MSMGDSASDLLCSSSGRRHLVQKIAKLLPKIAAPRPSFRFILGHQRAGLSFKFVKYNPDVGHLPAEN